jgi:hypothetical protein
MATTTKKTTAKSKSKSAKKSAPKKSNKKSSSAAKSNKSTSKKVTTVKAADTKTNKATTTKTTTIKSIKKEDSTTKKLRNLHVWNLSLAGIHALFGIIVLVLSVTALFPVTTTYLTADVLASSEGAPVLVSAVRNLFDVNLAYLIAAFFFMSSIAHFYVSTVYRKKYEADLLKGINRVRWYEYGISASTMMLAIAMLSGVSDISTLIMIFGATLVMNLCGLIMEVHNQTTQKTNWLSYVVGTIAGLGPWVVVGIYIWGANQYGQEGIPGFVYAIYASLFVFFSSFAVNMILQYKKTGKWNDYLFGEKAYMLLSLFAKTALAWQVFAGVLRP